MVDNSSIQQSSFIDSFWGTEDEDDIPPEIREFYDGFLEHTEKLKAEILSYDYIEEEGKKKYTVYNIKVTTDLFAYNLQKRFSEFDKLKNRLKAKYKELDLSQINFPSKTFWNNDIETIEKRKILLNEFLQYLSAECKKSLIVDYLEFLKIKEQMELSIHNQTSFPFSDKVYSTHLQEYSKIIQYLELLNKTPHDSTKLLKELETFYLQTRPKLNQDIIKLMIQGKGKTKGLIHFCGKFDKTSNTHLVCTIGLKLLFVLTDYSQCADAEQIIIFFGSLPSKYIGLLDLTSHIEGKLQKQCKSIALRLADIYLSRNPNIDPSTILKTEEALREYTSWILATKSTSIKAEQYSFNDKMDLNYQKMESRNAPIIDFKEEIESPEKIEKPVDTNWEIIYNSKGLKVKHSKNNVKIRFHSHLDCRHLGKYIRKGIDCYSLITDFQKLKEVDHETSIYFAKVKFNIKSYSQIVFIIERKREDIIEGEMQITENPCQHPLMLDSKEVIAKRNVKIEIKPSREENMQSKVKIFIENKDEYSKSLKDYLIDTKNKDGESVLIDNIQIFIDKMQKVVQKTSAS